MEKLHYNVVRTKFGRAKILCLLYRNLSMITIVLIVGIDLFLFCIFVVDNGVLFVELHNWIMLDPKNNLAENAKLLMNKVL